MPKYEVKERGFFNSKLYDPKGKRPFLFTDKPLKPVPTWLKPAKAETAAEKKMREGLEKRQIAADKKKAKEDRKDIENLSFMGEGENVPGSAVETL